MAYQRYNESELFAFRQKDKREMWKTIFNSLCILGQKDNVIIDAQGDENTKLTISRAIDILEEKTTELTQKIIELYPTEEAEKTPEYKEAELDEAIADTEKRLTQLKNIKSGRPS